MRSAFISCLVLSIASGGALRFDPPPVRCNPPLEEPELPMAALSSSEMTPRRVGAVAVEVALASGAAVGEADSVVASGGGCWVGLGGGGLGGCGHRQRRAAGAA